MTGGRVEYLGSEPPLRRWSWSRWPWLGRIVLPLLALVAVVGVAWLQRAGDESRSALAEGYSASLDEARAAEGRVEVSLAYVSPALWRPDLPPETEDALWQVVRKEADAAADRMSQVRERIDGITVLPWRADHVEARDALVRWVTAQEDRFRSMARDVRRVPSYLAGGPVPDGDAARALQSIGATIR